MLGPRQADVAERLKRRAATISSCERGLTLPRAGDVLRSARILGPTAEDLELGVLLDRQTAAAGDPRR